MAHTGRQSNQPSEAPTPPDSLAKSNVNDNELLSSSSCIAARIG